MIRVVQSGEDSNTLIEMHGSDEASSHSANPFQHRADPDSAHTKVTSELGLAGESAVSEHLPIEGSWSVIIDW